VITVHARAGVDHALDLPAWASIRVDGRCVAYALGNDYPRARLR
jgi:hypothetical protein